MEGDQEVAFAEVVGDDLPVSHERDDGRVN